ncbi:MAG: SLC13 family permease [Euryarchaeota archaeon]|nr:SLC13 family permease [Euryarchaeota archaeon]
MSEEEGKGPTGGDRPPMDRVPALPGAPPGPDIDIESGARSNVRRHEDTERFDLRRIPGGDRAPVRRLPSGQNLRRLRKLFFGIAFLAIYLLLPTPRDLSVEGKNAIGLFLFIVYLWVTEALPLPVTALLAGVGFLALGIRDDPNEAFEPYAQDAFFFILGSLILADGITKSGADEVLAHRMLSVFGRNTHTLLFGIVASSAILAAFLSDHVIAAIMLPIVLGILRNTGFKGDPKMAPAFLIAVAFGTNIAGLATPSGGSRNAVALGYLRDIYDVQVSYLDWMVLAAPLTLVLIPVTYIVIALAFRVPFKRLERAKVDPGAYRFTQPQWAAIAILAFTVVLWVLGSERFGLGAIAILGAVLMFVFGILDWEDTRSTIPWGVAFVYGAALAMGRVLKETLAAEWLAQHAFLLLPGQGAGIDILWLLIIIIVVIVIMTNFLSDGATVAVIAPITLSLAILAEFDVASMGIITAIASAFAFILVIGTPPNLIIYASGAVRPKDFAKAGIPMTIAALVVLVIAVQWLWPMLVPGL